jgi:N-acetylglucosaminyldiphosphoundecaprenol N-acetyl-beta-D-mannosaminyltransferase
VTERAVILGVPVDRLTTAQVVERVADFVARRVGAHIVTVNPEYVMAARRDATFHAVLERAELAVPDGIGLVWASRLLGQPVPERVAGVDLVPLIAEAAGTLNRSVFLLGGAPGVAESAAARLEGTGDRPAAFVAGTWSGSPSDRNAPAILERIARSDAAVVFVAFGAPSQDLWIARHRAALGDRVCMGVGGAFDFLAGVQKRAPEPARRIGLEWLWRLGREPWRWRRQLALPRFAFAVLGEAAKARLRRDRLATKS